METHFHGTEDQLELYALGRLPDLDLPMLEQHLMICAACREKLNGFEDFATGMREALSAKPTPRPEWFAWLRRPAVPGALTFAAGLAFAALIMVVGIFSHGSTKFAPSASLQLTAIRGELPLAAPARQFDLTLVDAPGEGGPFRIEIVNATGAQVWSGLAAGQRFKLQQRLGPGDYFVRLYAASGEMLREYGFRIRT